MRIIAPRLLLVASSIITLFHPALTLPTPCGSSSSNGKYSRALSPPTFPSTALDTYVNAPDPSFSWADTGITFSGAGWRGHVLNMSSQKWWVRASTAGASSFFLTRSHRMNESATTRSVWQVHTHRPYSPSLPPTPTRPSPSILSQSSFPTRLLSLAPLSTLLAVSQPLQQHVPRCDGF